MSEQMLDQGATGASASSLVSAAESGFKPYTSHYGSTPTTLTSTIQVPMKAFKVQATVVEFLAVITTLLMETCV